jgi:hypothetical protein
MPRELYKRRKERITVATTWEVVKSLGLVVEKPEPGQTLVYGSSDPRPNPSELFLTQFVASRHRLGWRFFVYRHGRNLPMTVDDPQWVNPPGVFYLESILPKDLTLGEMAREIWFLREEPAIVAHLSGGATLRATPDPSRKWSGGWAQKTIPQLHEAGGWLGGSSIHFLLRLWAEEREQMLYVCPFQEKGRVYELYAGFRPTFILAPFVRFVPPAQLGLPPWAPAPCGYWFSLPAAFRRRVKKEVRRRIWSGERRIEIQLP